MSNFNKNMKKAIIESKETAKAEEKRRKNVETEEENAYQNAIKRLNKNAKKKSNENRKLQELNVNGRIPKKVGSINFNKEPIETVIETLRNYNNRNKINAIRTIKNNSKIHAIIKALFGKNNNNGIQEYILLIEKLNSQNTLPSGFDEIIVLGDGSCFFHAIMKYYELNIFNGLPFAISDYLNKKNKEAKKFGYALRRATIAYFKNIWRPAHKNNEYVGNLNETLKELNEFDTGKIGELDTYAQNNIPRCVSDFLDINILIWDANSKIWFDVQTQTSININTYIKRQKTIYLILKNAHYNLLLKK